MDSDSQPPQHHHPHHHQFHHQQQPPRQPHHHQYMPPGSTTTLMMSPQHQQQQQQHQFHNQQMPPTQNANNSSNEISRFQFNSPVGPNSGSGGGVGGGMGATSNVEFSDGSGSSPKGGSGFSIEKPQKKRGRPRKYSPEAGNIGLRLSSGSGIDSGGGNGRGYSGGVGLGGVIGSAVSGGDISAKKSRGRPPGSGKKKLDSLGAMGLGFTPHVISVKAGEDIASKILAFAQQGPRTVCILSATGCICNVTLRQSSMSGGSVTYEGRFEILSLAGSFNPSENASRSGGLSVSLAGSDGRVVGGSVAGMLMAASPIQVIVGSFISDFKKLKAKPLSAAPSSNVLNFNAPGAGMLSSPSQGASSESSEENHHDSPLNHGSGSYNKDGQPMQNVPMYSPISWQNSSIKMPPN